MLINKWLDKNFNKIKRQLLQESLLITTKSNILNNTDPLACYSAGELIPF